MLEITKVYNIFFQNSRVKITRKQKKIKIELLKTIKTKVIFENENELQNFFLVLQYVVIFNFLKEGGTDTQKLLEMHHINYSLRISWVFPKNIVWKLSWAILLKVLETRKNFFGIFLKKLEQFLHFFCFCINFSKNCFDYFSWFSIFYWEWDCLVNHIIVKL